MSAVAKAALIEVGRTVRGLAMLAAVLVALLFVPQIIEGSSSSCGAVAAAGLRSSPPADLLPEGLIRSLGSALIERQVAIDTGLPPFIACFGAYWLVRAGALNLREVLR